jgi:uncharacterized protein YecE (DUF72 family)
VLLGIYIGSVNLPPPKLAGRLTFAELDATLSHIPRPKALATIKQKSGEKIALGIRALQHITHPASSPLFKKLSPPLPEADRPKVGLFQNTPQVAAAYEKTRAAADALSAKAIVFETPLEFTPTKENRERLIRFFQERDRGGRRMVWDPRGPWDPEQAREAAKAADILLARDPLSPAGFDDETPPDEGDVAYFRLRGPAGRRRRYAPFELEDLADLLSSYSEAYVVFLPSFVTDAADLAARVSRAQAAPAPEVLAPAEGVELAGEEE